MHGGNLSTNQVMVQATTNNNKNRTADSRTLMGKKGSEKKNYMFNVDSVEKD